MSGRHRVFAGAWTRRYGFHEDGFASGLRATAALPDVAPPFAIADADVERGEPRMGAIALLFDVLEVARAFAALLVWRVFFAVFKATEPVEQKVD